jgi:hypothetical protein
MVLPASTMRKLCDVLAAVSAERLGFKMVGMIAGGLVTRPASPAFFAFVLDADGGGWTPYKLKPEAKGAHEALASSWTWSVGVQAHHFADDVGRSVPSPSFAVLLPGVEEGLVAWLVERGYGAEAAGVQVVDAGMYNPVSARVMRVSW